MGIPHFLAIPFPLQGHVNPLMQFSHVLAKHGCKVTILHTEFIHRNNNSIVEGSQSNIKVVTLPDGLEPEDDRSDMLKVLLSIKRTMPCLLPKLIEDVNALDPENKISCIIVTPNLGWALELGQKKLGIKGALLSTTSATSSGSGVSVQRLLDDGIVDSAGLPTRKEEIQLSSGMPMIDTAHLPWRGVSKIWFTEMVHEMETLNVAEWWLCNTTYDLEPAAFTISSKFLPIGPLTEHCDNTTKNSKTSSSLWQEDITCLDWLDQQQPRSVIYASFGSLAMLEPNQFKELALALDLINKPFLLVKRGNDKNPYPDGFIGIKGKIVGWGPQRNILNHPAIACFISHCGWNSTLEGVCAGVPFLCWPFHGDQFLNKLYICDVWKVGVELDKDKNTLISKEEIKKKVERVIRDEEIKARCLKLKEVTLNNVVEGGKSCKNLDMFINWAK